jgi:hypothetical protein
MIKSGILIGLQPEQIRDMIPKDTWLVFEGWNDAHAPDDAKTEAMTADEYRQLVRQVDGN